MTLTPEDPGYMEQDAGPMLYQITFTCLAVASIIVSLRLFCRFHILRARHLNLSEWLIIAATLLDITSCILIHFQIQTGMGKHIEYSRARPAMLQKSMKVGLAQNSVYQALIGVIKTSILAQLHALAVPGAQQKIVVWIGGSVVVFTTFTTFAAIFQCIPMSAAWDLEHFPRGCWNMMAMNFFTSTINTLFDLVIFIIPLRTLMRLQMERKKKVALVVSYCVGSLAIACSIVRLRNMIFFQGVGDFTYVACMVPVWGAIECNAGIICASLPLIMPLFKRAHDSIIEMTSMSRPHQSSVQTHFNTERSEQGKSRARSSKRGSQWHELDAESIEPISPNDLKWEAASNSAILVTHRIEQQSENKEHSEKFPREAI